jgi:hypothetical protein
VRRRVKKLIGNDLFKPEQTVNVNACYYFGNQGEKAGDAGVNEKGPGRYQSETPRQRRA